MNGSAGGQYILTFNVEGQGAQMLGQITDLLLKMAQGTKGGQAALQGLINALASFGTKAGQAGAKAISLEAQISLVTRAMNELKGVADAMFNGGKSILNGWFQLGKGVLEATSPLETARNQMMILGKMSSDQANAVINGVQKMVAATPLQTQELVDLNVALVMGKVKLDAWTDSTGRAMTLGDQAAQGFSRLSGAALKMHGDMKISSASVMADFAALTGNVGDRMPGFIRGMQRAMSTGNTALLRDQISAPFLEAFNGQKSLSKMKGSAEEAMKRVYEVLKQNNAIGMAALASDTAQGIMSNFKEIPTLIFTAIGGGATSASDPNSVYSQIKRAFANMFGEISNIISNGDWIKGISRGITPVVKMFGFAMEFAGKAAAGVLQFFSDHPTITAWLGVMSVVVAVVGGLFVGALAIAALKAAGLAIALFSIKFAATAALPEIGAVTTALWAMVAPMLLIAGKVLLVVAAITAAYYAFKMLLSIFPEWQEFWTDIATFVGAVWEALSHWKDGVTSISTETAGKLRNSGMLGTFLELVKGIDEAKRSIEMLWKELSGPLFDSLSLVSDMMGTNTDAGRRHSRMLDDNKTGMQQFADACKVAFDIFISFVSKAGFVLAIVNILVTGFMEFGRVLTTVVIAALDVIGSTIWNILGMVKDLVMALVNLVAMDFSGVADSLKSAFSGDRWEGTWARPANAANRGLEDSQSRMADSFTFADRMGQAAFNPITGQNDAYKPDLGGVPGARGTPARMSEDSLRSAIESGLMDAVAASQKIKSGELVITTNLQVDSKTLATAVSRHSTKEEGRNFKPAGARGRG